ncbi:flagellar export chaperone FliS [Nocardioides carbamazepini]|uniref:flagellar export chaperone FliS n=1 Tax=Nocardioides carbamazepini TaxID=2854259 RepID=UPI00214A8902|nr:flagellar export chaperone FliS [Nocardioides carbamazepini]MCR1786382.1 flagellar export chaperone FliS [Nocardioides carbamazepini]
MNAMDAHAAYRSNSVATASPARLLVMLVERLVLDVERARSAQERGAWPDAHRDLLHAQDIVLELESSLVVDQMPAGRQLAALYAYLRGRLVEANVRRQVAVTDEALALARQLCDTWREAATAAVS